MVVKIVLHRKIGKISSSTVVELQTAGTPDLPPYSPPAGPGAEGSPVS